MSKKKIKYTPIMGDTLDLEVALTQAALALDAAGQIASKNGDSEALIGIADRWMRMCDGFTPPPAPSQSRQPIGFGIEQQHEIQEIAANERTTEQERREG